MRLLTGHAKAVRSVAYLPDGRLVSGGDDRTVRVWGASGACEWLFRPGGPVYAVAAAPDGRTVASAGRSQQPPYVVVSTMDSTNGKVSEQFLRSVQLVDRHGLAVTPSVWSLAFTTDDRFIVAGCRMLGSGNWSDGAGAVWWRRNGLCDSPVLGSGNAVAAGPAGSAIAVTFPHAVEVFDAPGGPARRRYEVRTAPEWWPVVTFLPGDRLAAVAGGWLLVFDPAARQPRRVRTGIARLAALAAHPDGRSVLVGGSPGGVERYDADTGERVAAHDFGVGKVHGLAFAPDGHTFAVAGHDGLAVCDAD